MFKFKLDESTQDRIAFVFRVGVCSLGCAASIALAVSTGEGRMVGRMREAVREYGVCQARVVPHSMANESVLVFDSNDDEAMALAKRRATEYENRSK